MPAQMPAAFAPSHARTSTPPRINLDTSFTFDVGPVSGTTSNFGAWECSECPPGFVSEARQYPCEPCSMGTSAEGAPAFLSFFDHRF